MQDGAEVLIAGTPTKGKKHHKSVEYYKQIAAIGESEEDARMRTSAYNISGERAPLSEEWELFNKFELNKDW